MHSTPLLGGNIAIAFDTLVRREYCHSVWCQLTRMVWLPDGEKSDDMFSRFDRILACDRQTDGRTDSIVW